MYFPISDRRFFGFLTVFAWFVIQSAAVPLTPTLVLTSRPNGLEPETEFMQTQTIHGYLTLSEKAFGKHQLEALWIKPDGVPQEKTVIQFDGGKDGRQTAYLWFRLNDSTDLLGRLPDDQAVAGLKGLWHVQILWDSTALIEKSFQIH